MIFKRIPAGSFMMGEGKNKHQVAIEKDFYLGKYPVTQAQWDAVMGENPSHFAGHPNHPVETVSWDDCHQFLKEINKKKLGKFRLPSEAEWEYACRAGTKTEYFWGDDPEEKEIGKYAWYRRNVGVQTHETGKKSPNAWGLHDMSGNVWEWCQDKYDKDSGSSRVLRGGGWGGAAVFCRSSFRFLNNPGSRFSTVGFRVIAFRT